MKTYNKFNTLAALILLGSATTSFAATDAQMEVTADMVAACEISVPATVDMGTINFLNAGDQYPLGNVTVTCTNGTSFSVAATSANAVSGQYNLSDGTHFIAYGAGADKYSATATSLYSIPSTVSAGPASPYVNAPVVFLNIADVGAAPAGVYTDTLTFTVSF